MKIFFRIALLICLIVSLQCTGKGIKRKSDVPKYEDILEGKKLVAGEGFPGIITVNDNTADMFNLFGDAREDMEIPFTYYYEDGSFKLSFLATFHRKTMTYIIEGIMYYDDPGKKIKTKKGITLGDDLSKVTTHYGTDFIDYNDTKIYDNLGIAFGVDEAGKVSRIAVFRIQIPELPKWLEPHAYKEELKKQTVLDVEIEVPDEWVASTEEADYYEMFEDPTGTHAVSVTREPDDGTIYFVEWYLYIESMFGTENVIPEKDIRPPKETIKEMNVNNALLSQSVDFFDDTTRYRVYSVYMEKEHYDKDTVENYFYLVSLEMEQDPKTTMIEPDSTELAIASAVMTSISVPGPLYPNLEKVIPKDKKMKELTRVFTDLVEASVYKDAYGLCELIVNNETDTPNQWKEPLDPNNDDHYGRALLVAQEIRHLLRGSPYSIEDLQVEKESEGVWHVLSVKNGFGELSYFAFLPYNNSYLLGEIE
jgi:hypothetical protein